MHYYVLLDINATPINTFDLRQMESPSLVTYWVRVKKLTRRIKMISLMILTQNGQIVKSYWPTNKTSVSDYVLMIVESISVSSEGWPSDIMHLKTVYKSILKFYGSIDVYKRKLELFPKFNSLVESIL